MAALLLLSCLSFLFAAAVAAARLEHELHEFRHVRPKINAVGFVYCDQCKRGLHANTTLPLPDVEVRVKCQDLYGFVTFSAVGFTNKDGAFSIPMDDIPSIFGISGCKAALVRSMNEHCDVMSNVGGGHEGAPLFLKSKSLKHVTFTTGPFAYHPYLPPTSCYESFHPFHTAGNTHYPSLSPSIPIGRHAYFYTSPPPLSTSPPPSLPPPPPPYWYKSPPPSPYYWYKSPPPPSIQSHSHPILSPHHQPYFSYHHYHHHHLHHSPPPPPPYFYGSTPPLIHSFPPPPYYHYYVPPPPPPYYTILPSPKHLQRSPSPPPLHHDYGSPPPHNSGNKYSPSPPPTQVRTPKMPYSNAPFWHWPSPPTLHFHNSPPPLVPQKVKAPPPYEHRPSPSATDLDRFTPPPLTSTPQKSSPPYLYMSPPPPPPPKY